MQLQITLDNEAKKAFATLGEALAIYQKTMAGKKTTAATTEEDAEETSHHDVGAMKKTAGKKTAPATAEEEETESFDDASDDTEESYGEEEETSEPEFTRKDVLAAMNAFAKKKGGKAALAVLGKYKVKSVKDLDEKHFAAVMKATK